LKRLAISSMTELQSRRLRRRLNRSHQATYAVSIAEQYSRPLRWHAGLTDISAFASPVSLDLPAKHTTCVKIETIKQNNMATLFIILFALVGGFILISEIVKQAQEIDALHMVIEQEEREICLYKQELSAWKGGLKEVTYEGDLFINGSLHTGKNGCIVIDGDLTHNIHRSHYSDEFRDACFEAPNIMNEDVNIEGKLVIVHGSLYVWLEAAKDPGTTGFIACNALTSHMALDFTGGGGPKS